MTNIQENFRSLKLTLVRHGESIDNLKPIWAGHRDATLSHFGHSQAVRLGLFFKDQSFDSIFCSDLKRAKFTANEIIEHNEKEKERRREKAEEKGKNKRLEEGEKEEGSKREMELLREQDFGRAEGERYDVGEYTTGEYYTNRSLKFTDGESREEVKKRAKKFINDVIIPTWTSQIAIKERKTEGSEEEIHFLIVSHGIFLSELMGAMNDLTGFSTQSIHPDHFSNTGWTRILLTAHFNNHQFESWVKLQTLASNQVSHLVGLQRQPGGIGSAPWDPKQSNLDTYFRKNSVPP